MEAMLFYPTMGATLVGPTPNHRIFAEIVKADARKTAFSRETVAGARTMVDAREDTDGTTAVLKEARRCATTITQCLTTKTLIEGAPDRWLEQSRFQTPSDENQPSEQPTAIEVGTASLWALSYGRKEVPFPPLRELKKGDRFISFPDGPDLGGYLHFNVFCKLEPADRRMRRISPLLSRCGIILRTGSSNWFGSDVDAMPPYQIERHVHGWLVHGIIPLDEFGAITRIAPDGAVMHGGIAAHFKQRIHRNTGSGIGTPARPK